MSWNEKVDICGCAERAGGGEGESDGGVGERGSGRTGRGKIRTYLERARKLNDLELGAGETAECTGLECRLKLTIVGL